jgi:hypothetical protein
MLTTKVSEIYERDNIIIVVTDNSVYYLERME